MQLIKEINTQIFGRPADLFIYKGEYQDGSLAIEITEFDSEDKCEYPYTRLSVWIKESADLPNNEFYAKVWSENTPIANILLAEGVFEQTDKSAVTGFVEAPVWRLV
jgi:uncharacterized protein YpmS